MSQEQEHFNKTVWLFFCLDYFNNVTLIASLCTVAATLIILIVSIRLTRMWHNHS